METIWVTVEDLENVTGQGQSVLTFTGHDEQGREVRFGVDHRPAAEIIGLVHEHGELPCAVEGWQILGGRLPV